MAQLLHMPEVAAGSISAVLASWSVAENDTVAAGDVLAEIETDKAVVDFPAEAGGLVLKLLVTAGTEVRVGDPIALLGSAADQGGDVDALLAASGLATPAPAPDTTPAAPAEPSGAPGPEELPGTVEPDPAGPASPEGPDEPGGTTNHEAPALQHVTDGVHGSGRVFASPLARRLARDAQLALDDLGPGSGPGGRIRRIDVQAAIAAHNDQRPAAPASAPAPIAPDTAAAATGAAPTARNAAAPTTVAANSATAAGTGYTDQPHTKLRRVIAARLTESKQTVPHFYLNGSAPVDRLLELRREVNNDGTSRVSVNDLIVKAAAKTHALMPEMNVIWTPDAVRQFDHVDVSVAVASDRGLVTPTLRAVESMSIGAVSAAVKDFVQRAGAGKLKQEELSGGALSVTNLGMFGTEDFGAIINPPQSAILAVGAATPQPVVVDGELAVATVLRVTLSVDHRAIDGRLAAEWLRLFLQIVQQPLRILT